MLPSFVFTATRSPPVFDHLPSKEGRSFYSSRSPPSLRDTSPRGVEELVAFAFHPSSPTLMKQGGSALQGRGGIKLCLIDYVCSNRSRKARVANNKHCQLIHSSSRSPPSLCDTSPRRVEVLVCFCISSQLSHLDVTRGECPARARGN